MRLAIYPGSFDPIHNGHLDVIERAARISDQVIVAVARNDQKTGLFSIEERVGIIEKSVAHLPSVTVDTFEGLLVQFARQRGAQALIRGLRAVSDFEFEFQMALMNRKLDSELETIFLMPNEEHIYLSSRIVKEIARLGGEVDAFLPPAAAEALRARDQS